MDRGYTHIYTGNGKGKTTAALGLVMRAAGAGLRVRLIQFLKSGDYSEHRALTRFADQVEVEQFGTGRFVRGNPGPEDFESAKKGLAEAQKALFSGLFDMVVLDEAVVAAKTGLFREDDLLALMAAKPANMELVLTGRGASDDLIAAADLVTEMVERKHYFKEGVPARVGVEK